MPADLNDTDHDRDADVEGEPSAEVDPGRTSTAEADRSSEREHAASEFGDGSLLVVGAGTVGRWIASVLDVADTAFCDTDFDTAVEAAEAVGGRAVERDTNERFDLVGIAVPISVAEEAIATHAPKARHGVFDVTGTMGEPVTAMAEHAPAVERVSLHPLFAPERAPGRVAMVIDGVVNEGADDTDIHDQDDGKERDGSEHEHDRGDGGGGGRVAAAIEGALRAAGNEPFATTATEHDRAMETVQARAHAAVLAFSLAAEPIDERFHTPVSESLAAVAAQVTDGSPRTYAEIQATFDGAADIAAAADRIVEADSEGFRRLYREAKANEANGEEG